MRSYKTCRETKTVQTHRVFPNDLNHHQTLFGGALMSLIDDTASISASRHARRLCVTASIDSLDFIHPIHADNSVCVETYVSGTGKTSIEVFAKVMGENLLTGERYLAATCFLTFVALPRDESDDVVVPQIKPESKEETMVCRDYLKRRENRKHTQQFHQQFNESVSYCPPWIESTDCSVLD